MKTTTNTFSFIQKTKKIRRKECKQINFPFSKLPKYPKNHFFCLLFHQKKKGLIIFIALVL